MRQKTASALDNTKEYLVSISDELTSDFISVQKGLWGLNSDINPSEVFLLDIEIFPDGYGLALYPMDKDLNQLGFLKLLEKYPDGPLRGNDHGLDTSLYDFNNIEDVNEVNEYYSQLTGFYVNWAAQCWDKAGGQRFKKPIYIMMHDCVTSYNLLNKKWVDDDKKWS